MISVEYKEGDYGTQARRERLREEATARGKYYCGRTQNGMQCFTDTLGNKKRQTILNSWGLAGYNRQEQK